MKQRTDWIARIALGVSIAAAFFSGLQWLEAREQRTLQFDSELVFDIDTELPQHRAGIAIRNVGPGTARVRSVTYYLDGKVIDDPSQILDQVKLDSNKDEGIDLDGGDSMAPGEIDWLVRYPLKRRGEQDLAAEVFEQRLQIGIEYCSANGKCARTCSIPHGCPVPDRNR